MAGITHDAVLPWYAKPNSERADYRDATEKGVLAEICSGYELHGDDAVIEAMIGVTTLQLPPAVRRQVITIWPWAAA